LQYPEIDSHARQVIKTLNSMETAATTIDGRWFNVRIMPYRTLDDRIDGVVMTFTDTTIANMAEKALTISETRYRRLFEAVQDGILILDAETGQVMDANPFLIELLGCSTEQFTKKPVWELGFFKDIAANKDTFLALQQKELVRYKDVPLETADGRMINVEFISTAYSVYSQKVIQCIIRDTTVRKQAEEARRQKQR